MKVVDTHIVLLVASHAPESGGRRWALTCLFRGGPKLPPSILPMALGLAITGNHGPYSHGLRHGRGSIGMHNCFLQDYRVLGLAGAFRIARHVDLRLPMPSKTVWAGPIEPRPLGPGVLTVSLDAHDT